MSQGNQPDWINLRGSVAVKVTKVSQMVMIRDFKVGLVLDKYFLLFESCIE